MLNINLKQFRNKLYTVCLNRDLFREAPSTGFQITNEKEKCL